MNVFGISVLSVRIDTCNVYRWTSKAKEVCLLNPVWLALFSKPEKSKHCLFDFAYINWQNVSEEAILFQSVSTQGYFWDGIPN
jgi:hypothetical protein